MKATAKILHIDELRARRRQPPARPAPMVERRPLSAQVTAFQPTLVSAGLSPEAFERRRREVLAQAHAYMERRAWRERRQRGDAS